MTGLPDLPHIEITKAEDLWTRLDQKDLEGSVLLITWKAAERDKYVSRDQVLDALVAHNWIDGRRWRHTDPKRTIQLISPRAQQVWAKTYKDRAARLIEEGRMRPAGLAAYQAAQARPNWSQSDPVDALEIPQDLSDALEAGGGMAWFETSAPSYRRNVLRFLASAKRSETRTKRIHLIVDHAAKGKKLPNY